LKSFNESAEEADLDFSATPEERAALDHAARLTSVAPEDYSFFLSQFKVSYESLRDRTGPGGERFTLTEED
jgi:hypothetical protein